MIVYNALKTPDGTILESLHVHDHVTYKDKNGKTYMIDGGTHYVRYSTNGDEELLTVCDTDNYSCVRKFAYRTGYGKPGTLDYGIFRRTILKDMTDGHLQASIEYVHPGGPHWVLYLREKMYRIENEISIPD